MKCAGCSREAKYFVHVQLQPHCQPCMIESLCSKPTQVIDIESWEEKQNEQIRFTKLISA